MAAIVVSFASTVQGEVVYQRLKSFGFSDQLGITPQSGLVTGNDGAFYGTTYSGGLIGGGAGVVYRIEPDGSGYQILHVFPGGTNAANPAAALLAIGNKLYGTASGGGNSPSVNQNAGVVFQVNTDGTGYSELHTFGGTNDGITPRARLIVGSDGNLYGTTYAGGHFHLGTVFKLAQDGSSYSVLHDFSGGTDGSDPSSGLVCGSDGTLYGATQFGGNTNRASYGTLFRLNEDGSGYTVLYSFGNTNGSQPRGDLILGPNNTLLGTTSLGGGHNSGTVFSMNENGSGFATIYNFGSSVADGSSPTAALLLGADGFLYGTTSGGGTNKGGTVFKLHPDGSDYAVLTQFATDGSSLQELVFGTNGDLYGTKSSGGAESYGFIFKISPDGTSLATVRSFYQHGGDARSAGTTLIRASDGFLYGTAPGGGADDAGAIYRFSEDGSNYTLIHSFVPSEGASPTRLLEAIPGVLFGAAESGGQSNMGTVFRVDTGGSNFMVLHNFTGGAADGQRPLGGLMLARDGALYGTTTYGGSGFGTIYRIMPDGSDFQVVYTFLTNPTNGPNYGLIPVCPLVQGSDNALYGTTDAGGEFGRGSVFKVNTDGSGFTVLHPFASDASDGGGFSSSGLLLGPDNALYGVTAAGSSGSGCVFRVTQDGSEYTVLHLFAGSDGWNPQGELIVGADGALYGATQFGGTFSSQGGVVYRIDTDGTGFSVLHSFAFPVGPEGARPTCGLVLGASGKLFGVTPLGGDFSDGVLYCVDPATVTNNPPSLVSPLPDQSLYLFEPFSYAVPVGTFFDRDWGETLTYSASGLPPGLSFDPATATFSGTPTGPGVWHITVTAMDNGLPSPLSASDTFQFSALAPALAISVQTNTVVISWPEATYRFYLEQSSQLGPGAVWTSLGEPGGYQIGSRFYAPLPLQPGKRYYRLSGPH